MGLGHSPAVDTTSLQLCLDAANSKSYAGSGTTWTDLSGNSRNFTLVNGAYEVPGYLGVMNFSSASSQYASSSYAPVFTGDFTIQCWVYFKTYIDYQNIISSANSGAANYGFWLEFGYARGFTLYQGLTGTAILVLEDNVVNLTTLATNTWHHVCVVRSGAGANNIKLYVDNVLCGQNTYTSTIGLATQNLLIAKYGQSDNTNYFNGYLANLMIQHSAITSDQLARNYAAGSGRFTSFYLAPIATTSLVLNLDAGNPSSYSGSGTTWTDLSGNNNNATLVSGPTFETSNGGSIFFNGSNYATMPNGLLTGTGDFTVSQWIKADASEIGGTTFCNYPAGNLQIFYGSSYIGFWLANSTAYLSAPVPFTTNWVNITAMRSGTATYFYINGVLQKIGSSSADIGTGSAAFRLGTNTNSGEQFTGNISATQVYSRALSNAEIIQNYNALRGRFGL